MTWTAFMLVPWVHQLRAIQCISRALADDILVIAQGQFHEERFRAGYEATLRYMQALGLKVSHKKCFLFPLYPKPDPSLPIMSGLLFTSPSLSFYTSGT